MQDNESPADEKRKQGGSLSTGVWIAASFSIAVAALVLVLKHGNDDTPSAAVFKSGLFEADAKNASEVAALQANGTFSVPVFLNTTEDVYRVDLEDLRGADGADGRNGTDGTNATVTFDAVAAVLADLSAGSAAYNGSVVVLGAGGDDMVVVPLAAVLAAAEPTLAELLAIHATLGAANGSFNGSVLVVAANGSSAVAVPLADLVPAPAPVGLPVPVWMAASVGLDMIVSFGAEINGPASTSAFGKVMWLNEWTVALTVSYYSMETYAFASMPVFFDLVFDVNEDLENYLAANNLLLSPAFGNQVFPIAMSHTAANTHFPGVVTVYGANAGNGYRIQFANTDDLSGIGYIGWHAFTITYSVASV